MSTLTGTSATSDDFVSVDQLRAAQVALDARGLRATGSPEHEDYVEDLARRLRLAGAEDVHLEGIPMRRWTPKSWGLRVTASGAEVELPVVSYVAYSGSTPSSGVVGELSTTPGPGVVGVVDVPLVGMAAADFDALDWDAPHQPDHGADWDPEARYERVWLSQDLMRAALAEHEQAGAAGLVIVVDVPEAEIPGAYLLYDGIHRSIPALFVARETGQRLHDLMRGEAPATCHLVLEAVVEECETHNVLGYLPGASDELVVVQSHTDGPNGLEDNGPEAILAMVAHLASKPASSRPRGILVLLSTGHFAIEEAWGLEEFLRDHAEDLVPRIAAVLSLEHLGALSRAEDYPGGPVPPVHEFGCCFATPHRAVIDIVRAAMTRAEVTDSIVLRPFVPDTTGNSPDGTSWPGDGCPFWHTAGLPTANFITGPGYTFNVEDVTRYIDVEALRRQVIAFTEAVLELARTPWATLREPVGARDS